MSNSYLFPRIFVFLCFVLVYTGMKAQSSVFSADRYNTIFSESNNKANGSGSYFFAGRTIGGAGTDIRRGLLHFDISSIPAGMQIDSVVLKVTLSKTKPGTRNVSIHKITSNWGSGTSDAALNEGKGATATLNDATWSCTFSDGAGGCNSTWDNLGGDFIGAATATTAVTGVGVYTWTSSTLATVVQSWYNSPATNYGIIFIGDESTTGTAKRFTSSTAQLTVMYSATPTNTVVTQEPTDSLVCSGSDGAFSITATNATGYQWQENTGSSWVNLSNGGVYGGVTTNTLTLTGVTLSMGNNQYRCIVSGNVNNDTSAAGTLMVASTPIVSIFSDDTGMCPGDSIKLKGALGFSNQWYFNGTAISGANDSIYYAKDSGVYNLTITNIPGCWDSASTGISISLYTVPKVTFDVSDTTICDTASITITASGGGSSQWYQDGMEISGATGSSYTASVAGTYNMTKTNMSGCSDSAAVGVTISTEECIVEGINDLIDHVIDIYPNPATNEINFRWHRTTGFNYQIQLRSLDGKVIQSVTSTSSVTSILLDREQIPAGLYLIRILDNQNARSWSKRIILK